MRAALGLRLLAFQRGGAVAFARVRRGLKIQGDETVMRQDGGDRARRGFRVGRIDDTRTEVGERRDGLVHYPAPGGPVPFGRLRRVAGAAPNPGTGGARAWPGL